MQWHAARDDIDPDFSFGETMALRQRRRDRTNFRDS
jgi:hypothetical protein